MTFDPKELPFVVRGDGKMKDELMRLEEELSTLKKQLDKLLKSGGAQNDPEQINELRRSIEVITAKIK